jgi:hypothetical protein
VEIVLSGVVGAALVETDSAVAVDAAVSLSEERSASTPATTATAMTAATTIQVNQLRSIFMLPLLYGDAWSTEHETPYPSA